MPTSDPDLLVIVDGASHQVPASAAPVSLGSDPMADIVLPGRPERVAELVLDAQGRWALVVLPGIGPVSPLGPAREDGSVVLSAISAPQVTITTESGPVQLELREVAAEEVASQGASAVPAQKKRRGMDEMPDEFAQSWDLPEGSALTIGRAGGPADVAVPGMELAIMDTVVRREGDHLQVKAAGRSTGLSVRGQRMHRARLAAGEAFRLGHHRFWFTGKELGWERADDPGHLYLHGLTVTHYGKKQPTTENITLELPTGSFLAVLGPSGVGKSTMAAALLGEAQSEGFAVLGGDPLGGGRMPNPSMVSFVPQRGTAPGEMTVWQTLDIAARMRLARDLSGSERRERIEDTLDRLGLAAYAKQKVRSLSGGQQRRLSVAMEMITQPRLLILDEPTSGLDDGLDRTLMQDLRRVADSGTTVIVITHSLSHLQYATHVLALTGKEPEPGEPRTPSQVGYFGPPDALFEAFGAKHPADIMDALRSGQQVASPMDLDPATARPSQDPTHSTAARKRRQNLSLWRSYFVSLRRENLRQRLNLMQVFWMSVIAPVLVGLMAVAVSARGLNGNGGNNGLNRNPDMPTVLSVVVISLAFLSMALSLTSVVTDLPILVRERRWGVRSTGVIAAKATVRVLPALLQAAIMLGTLWFLRPRPERTLTDLPPFLVLYLPLALLALACMGIGLLISTLAGTAERAVGAMSALLAVMVVLCGLVIPLGDSQGARKFLAWMSYGTPTRWSVSSIGAGVDMGAVTFMVPDPMWTFDMRHYLVPMAVLVAFAVGAVALSAASLGGVMTRARRQGV